MSIKRRSSRDKYFPFVIVHKPIKIDKAGPDEELTYQRADDLFFVINTIHKRSHLQIFSVAFLSLIALAIFGYCGNRPEPKYSVVMFTVFLLIFGTWSVLEILLVYTGPDKFVILDRMNGLITLPNLWWGRSATIPFDQAKSYCMVSSDGFANISLNIKRPGLGYVALSTREVDETWSFFVWYMDKNRPLPPGKAFDPYRERDEERRKAEGYPPPLYHSFIEMNEPKVAAKKKRRSKGR